MFTYRTQIRLKDTDATGVLYFSEQFKFAMEAFEEFLKARGFAWSDLMGSQYFLPVVRAEADYLSPLKVGDDLEVCLFVDKIGTSSITLLYILKNKETLVGKARIVHVAIDQQTRKPVPIPDFLRAVFEFDTDAALEQPN